MNKYKGIAIAGIFFASLGVFLGVPVEKVEAVTILPADCAISSADIAGIKVIQNDPTLSASAEVQAELTARKQLVAKVIDCGKNEAQSLSSALGTAPGATGAQSIKDQLSGKLNDANNFYDIESGKLLDAGIAGTQSIAKEILAWRQGTYAPLSGEVGNFIIWAQNQVLFNTAQSRMNQTERAVSFIESASGGADIQSAFNDAKGAFNGALNQNAAAQTALAQFLPPDQTLALIKGSLKSLSDTYQKLFDVSTLIAKVLPQ